MYLPPQSQLNKDFIKEMLRGDKKVFKITEVNYIKVPKLPEISVKLVLNMLQKDRELAMYYPSDFT